MNGDIANTVFIRGFDFGTPDQVLREHFGRVGRILAMVPRGKGGVVVTYSKIADADQALRNLHGTVIEGNQRYIEVLAGTQADASLTSEHLATAPARQPRPVNAAPPVKRQRVAALQPPPPAPVPAAPSRQARGKGLPSRPPKAPPAPPSASGFPGPEDDELMEAVEAQRSMSNEDDFSNDLGPDEAPPLDELPLEEDYEVAVEAEEDELAPPGEDWSHAEGTLQDLVEWTGALTQAWDLFVAATPNPSGRTLGHFLAGLPLDAQQTLRNSLQAQ